MAEHEQQDQCGAGSDDEFETVVRKRHSNSHANNYYSQKFRNGGMDYSNTYNGGGGGGAGRGRDRERGGRDFRSSSSSNTNNSRNFRRKPYRERDFHSENRRFPYGEHRDNKLQQNNVVLPTSHNSNNNNQQTQFPQTNNHSSTSISIIHTASMTHNNTNTVGHISGGGEPSSCTNYVTLNSRLTVTNGSVCSESGSSSAESVHSNTGGLLDVVDAQINHNCHVSGGSICGSASTCDTDLAQIIQIEEEELRSPLVVVAPPPPVNPWRVNPNAASVITKKSPAFHKLASAEAVNSANTTQISSQMNNQTQENYNAPRSNPVGGMNSGGGSKSTSKKDMIKKRNNVPLPNNTNKPRSSSSCKPDLKLDMSRDGNVLKDNYTSPMDSPMSSKAAELSSENGADSPKDAHKGECCDPDIVAQPEVVEELIITPAPPPLVNPWQANKNAVSVITGRVESALPKIAQQPLPTTTPGSSPLLTPIVENKARNTEMSTGNSTANIKTTPLLQPTTSTLSDAAKTQKTTSFVSTKPTTNASQIANCTSLADAEPIVLLAVLTPRHDTATTGEDMTDGLAQSLHKDIQPQQGPKFRRGFAAVTKHRHKGISTNSALSSIRNSPEDWPSLQTTVIVTMPQPQAKPVISLPVSPVKKMTGANHGGGDESTATKCNSDDILGLQKPETPPTSANNWPSMVNPIVAGDNNKESSLESGWHSGSDLNNEDTPSETSSGEILTNNKDLLPDEVNSGNQSENGSLESGSSEDQSVDNELETDGSGVSKKGKKSKQKWTKLDLPQTPSAKTRSRQERQSMEKERLEKGTINKESVDSLHQNESKPKSKGSFNNNNNNNNSKDNFVNAKLANGPNNDARQNYPSRGRGRAGGVRGRSGRTGGGRGQYWSYRESQATDIIITTQQLQDYLSVEEYQDYPADYTTLPPLYPVTEFAMPYVGEPFFHPTSALTTTQEQTSYSSPTNNTTEDGTPSNTILDSVQKQIEYYFSEENLGKDFYLRRRMDPEGYLPINFIATFPRLKTLTQDLASVIQAIQASQDLDLKLTEDFTYVRTRISPEKWPILNDDAPPAPTSNATSQPLLPTPASSASPFVTYHYPPNGSCDMLSSDASSSNHSSFSPSGINLNPDVPEFVPKSNINVSLTA